MVDSNRKTTKVGRSLAIANHKISFLVIHLKKNKTALQRQMVVVADHWNRCIRSDSRGHGQTDGRQRYNRQYLQSNPHPTVPSGGGGVQGSIRGSRAALAHS